MSHASFQWEDPLLLEAQLSDEERLVREATNVCCRACVTRTGMSVSTARS